MTILALASTKNDNDDDTTDHDAALATVASPPTNSLSPEPLHIMQQLETQGLQ